MIKPGYYRFMLCFAKRQKARPALAIAFAALWAMLLLAQISCTQVRRPAPVFDRYPETAKPAVKPKPEAPAAEAVKPGFYVVKKGDTLYSVALDHNVDYHDLADWNNIEANQVIRIGQQLRVTAPEGAAVTAPLKPSPVTIPSAADSSAAPSAPPAKPGPSAGAIKTEPKANKLAYSDQALARLMSGASGLATEPKKAEATKAETTIAKAEPSTRSPGAVAKVPVEPGAPNAEAGEEGINWGWPASGKVIAGFNESDNLKGVDIAGKRGQAVIASAPGRVVYSGAGLRGYGKLVIIRHNKTYLSAYAHNSEILVKEGQLVAKGQKIAEMGDSDADQVKLHFEIRRLGKPVDPVKYLPGDKS